MGGNIRDLDALHQVMRGEITLDKACEGMTDDFEIGHVSHRADGDWRKVAQGKWVPVKAADQGQMGAKKEKPYVASGREIEMFKTDASNMSTEQLKYKVDALKGNSPGEPKEFREEKIKIYGDELAKRTAGNGDVPLQNRLGSAENHEQMTKVLYDEITRNGKENTVEKLWALYKGEDLGADMQTYIEETGKETGLRGKDACRMVIEKAEEDGAPLREGEKIPQKEIPDEIAPMIRHYNGLIDKWNKQIDNAHPAGETYQRIYGYIKNLSEQMDTNLSDPDVLEEHKTPMRDVKERLAGLKKKLIANGEKSAYGNRKHSGLEMLKENAKQLNEALAEGKKRGASVVEFTDSMGKTYKRYWNGARYEDKPSRMAEQYGGPDRPQGIYKATFQKSATDAAPVRLTADTKIKLSQIKRGQTQDERRFYKPGEISQKTGLQKQQDGSWAPPKQGGTPQETAGNLAARGYVKEINSKTNNIEKRDKLLTKKFTELFGTKGPSSFETMGELYSRVKKAKPHTDEWYIAMNNYDMANRLYHDVIGSDNVDYYNKQIESLRMIPNYGKDPQETKVKETIKAEINGDADIQKALQTYMNNHTRNDYYKGFKVKVKNGYVTVEKDGQESEHMFKYDPGEKDGHGDDWNEGALGNLVQSWGRGKRKPASGIGKDTKIKLSQIKKEYAPESSKMDSSITDWTTRNKLNGHYKPENNLTFQELYEGMQKGKDVDEMLGIHESETRWRVLEELARRTGKSFDEIDELYKKTL